MCATVWERNVRLRIWSEHILHTTTFISHASYSYPAQVKYERKKMSLSSRFTSFSTASLSSYHYDHTLHLKKKHVFIYIYVVPVPLQSHERKKFVSVKILSHSLYRRCNCNWKQPLERNPRDATTQLSWNYRASSIHYRSHRQQRRTMPYRALPFFDRDTIYEREREENMSVTKHCFT